MNEMAINITISVRKNTLYRLTRTLDELGLLKGYAAQFNRNAFYVRLSRLFNLPG